MMSEENFPRPRSFYRIYSSNLEVLTVTIAKKKTKLTLYETVGMLCFVVSHFLSYFQTVWLIHGGVQNYG